MSKETTTKGIFLKSIVESVKKAKGEKGLKDLEKIYGSLNFGGFKDYPMEEEIRLYQAAMKVMGMEESPEAWREMGRLAFNTYADSIIGKTMFSLFQNDFGRMVLSVGKILDTVTAGYDIKVESLGDSKARIRISNCPDKIEFYEGVFHAAFDNFGQKHNLESKELNKDDYEYTLEWNL